MPLHQFMIQRHLLKTFKCLPKFVYFKKYFQKNGGLIINKFRKKNVSLRAVRNLLQREKQVIVYNSILYIFVSLSSKPEERYKAFAATRDGREVSITAPPISPANSTAKRNKQRPIEQPRIDSSTTTSSTHHLRPVGARYVAKVSIPHIFLLLVATRR